MLVLGAAGGVGHFAVQIAKARGAWVAGTSSVEKHDFLRGLGVDEPLDKTASLRRGGRCARHGRREAGLPALRRCATAGRSSRFHVCVPALEEAAAGRVRVAGILVEPDRLGLAGLAAIGLKPHVEATFPLEEAARAMSSASRAAPVGRSS